MAAQEVPIYVGLFAFYAAVLKSTGRPLSRRGGTRACPAHPAVEIAVNGGHGRIIMSLVREARHTISPFLVVKTSDW